MILNVVRRTIFNASTSCIRHNSQIVVADIPKVAVVLSGCGYLDGAEIHESVSVLSHLTRNGAAPHCYALDNKQFHVIDHSKAQEDSSHCRSIISESSRIARNPVKSLDALIEDFSCFSAIIFPGGFGVTKNFSDFAEKGSDFEMNPQVKTILKMFHDAKKPIGLICISPILAARLFPGVAITLGRSSPSEKWPYREAIDAAQRMGASIEFKGVEEVCADFKNMVFSTPAYMYDGEYHEVDDGIGKLIMFVLTAACTK